MTGSSEMPLHNELNMMHAAGEPARRHNSGTLRPEER